MSAKISTAALAAIAIGLILPTTADAQNRRSGAQRTQDQQMANIPRCTTNLGTITITDGQSHYWRELQLSPPQSLLRVVIQRSGCFTLVERGAGNEVAERERNMASSGNLQRGSNLGGGQVRAADYVLVGEIASQNANSGGGAVAGIAGAVLGGRAGAIVGGLRSRNMEANTVLSLSSVRTLETVAVTEGYASRSNISWGAGAGGFGAGALGGGAYENTEIGRIVAASFIQAYTDMVTQLGGLSGNAASEAPIQTYTVQQASTLRASPSSSGAVVRALPVGLRLYPTGQRDGVWWEVMDDNDNVGWVQNERLAPGT